MRGYFIGNFLYFLHIHLWLPEFRENQSKFTTKSETTIAYRLMKKTDSQNIMPQTLWKSTLTDIGNIGTVHGIKMQYLQPVLDTEMFLAQAM